MDVERAAELYTGGMSLSEVATHLGVAPDTARRHLRQAGVTIARLADRDRRPVCVRVHVSGVTSSLLPWPNRRPSA
jgi:orotate phosphoribosyltransferase-like protein